MTEMISREAADKIIGELRRVGDYRTGALDSIVGLWWVQQLIEKYTEQPQRKCSAWCATRDVAVPHRVCCFVVGEHTIHSANVDGKVIAWSEGGDE